MVLLPTRLQFEQWVPVPIEKVFEFFSDPDNLPRLMPAASATRLSALNRAPAPPSPTGTSAPKAAGVGTTIVTTFRVFPRLPFRSKWIARITEFEWNHHFADVQDRGPFKNWHHRHEFSTEVRSGTNGTTVRDQIEYEVGFGPLGQLVDSLFVRRQMSRTFAERQSKLPQLLE